MVDALSLVMHDAITRGTLQEFIICRQAPGISHLLFADDCLLFFKPSLNQALVIKKILAVYELGTGQKLSPDKCYIRFG